MIAETLSTIKKIELINKSEFTTIVLDKNTEIFIIYVTILSVALAI